MRRLLMVLSVAALLLAGRDVRSQTTNIQDYNAARAAIQSKSAPDRAAGLSFMALLGEEAKGSSREVVGLLFDSNADVRMWATLALPKVNPEIAEPVLALVKSKDPDKRIEAVAAIAKLGDTAAAAIPALLAFLQQAEGPNRAVVVSALISVGNKDTAMGATLAKIGSSDPDPKVRAVALAGLTRLADPKSAINVYAAMLNDADPATRATAVRGLAFLAPKSREALQLIRNAVNDASPTVSNAAKQALAQLQPKK